MAQHSLNIKKQLGMGMSDVNMVAFSKVTFPAMPTNPVVNTVPWRAAFTLLELLHICHGLVDEPTILLSQIHIHDSHGAPYIQRLRKNHTTTGSPLHSG